jgi:cyclopropane fatty-acyl-phospholipid synthase-like methyltransferase
MTTCELCGRGGAPVPFYPRQRIVRCPDCDLVFYESAVQAEALYGENYFNGGEYLDYVADKDVLQRNFRKRLPALRRFAPTGSLLEIGAAFGFFLEVARDHWQVRGIDVSSAGVAHMRDVLGVDAVQADFLDLPDEPERYDVICLWDTIEHLSHPVRYIEKAARWLKPGGLLAMTTGDLGSLLARLRRDRWRQIHPPTHLFYFSSRTLTAAVERAGLTVCHREHVGQSRSYRSMVHGICTLGRKKAPWLYEAATLGGRLDFPVYLNLYDTLLLMARKPLRPGVTLAAPTGDAARPAELPKEGASRS